jgi:hypothetical protein
MSTNILDCRTTDLGVLNTIATMSLLQCPRWLAVHPRVAVVERTGIPA